MLPGWLSWGYPFGLIAVALILFALLALRPRARARGASPGCPGCSAPWPACFTPGRARLLILILGVAELVRWREHRRGAALRAARCSPWS